jgi:hypothetical protein
MERYLLFSGEAYYPQGGAEDFRGSYATVAECMQADGIFADWWNILDTRTGRVYNHYETNANFDRGLLEERLEWAAGIDAGEDI